MEFPDLAGLVAGGALARRRRRARQHLGRRHRLRPLRHPGARRRHGRGRHLDAGAHQVPLGRRRRADGLGDDARRGAAPEAQGRAHAPGPGRGRQRLRARAALAADARRCATPRTTRARARSPRWLAGRAEVARVLHPALPGAPGHAHWRATCTRRRRPVLGRLRPALTAPSASTPSSTRCGCSASATRGPGRSASRCPTGCTACAAGRPSRLACWCASRPVWKTPPTSSPTCGRRSGRCAAEAPRRGLAQGCAGPAPPGHGRRLHREPRLRPRPGSAGRRPLRRAGHASSRDGAAPCSEGRVLSAIEVPASRIRTPCGALGVLCYTVTFGTSIVDNIVINLNQSLIQGMLLREEISGCSRDMGMDPTFEWLFLTSHSANLPTRCKDCGKRPPVATENAL